MKKPCTACGKQIPSVALDCVFCGVRQATAEGAVTPAEAASGSMTDPTLVGLRTGDPGGAPGKPLLGMPTAELSAVVSSALDEQPAGAHGANGSAADGPARHSDGAADAESGHNGASMPSQAKLTGVMQAVQLPDTLPSGESAMPGASALPPAEPVLVPDTMPSVAPHAAPAEASRPFSTLSRLIMGGGGAVLIALFFLPWHGVSSWQLLETLGGADFMRQLFYLTGGIVLVVSALLPLPFTFRAAVGATVAATPVLLGAGGMIEGWRGVVAALAILGLPATHLLRARAKSSSAARGLVLVAVFAVAILYLAPVGSVVPIVGVLKMIFSGEIGPAVMGIFVLIPLVFAALSLLGLLGRDLTDVGVLLSVLSLLWAPLVVALRGLLIEDGTQVYVAVALLWASATAALSLAQLLSLAARETPAT